MIWGSSKPCHPSGALYEPSLSQGPLPFVVGNFSQVAGENCRELLGVEIRSGFHSEFWCFCSIEVWHMGECTGFEHTARGEPGRAAVPPWDFAESTSGSRMYVGTLQSLSWD